MFQGSILLQVSLLPFRWLHSTSVGVHLSLFVLFKLVLTLSVWFQEAGGYLAALASYIEPSDASPLKVAK